MKYKSQCLTCNASPVAPLVGAWIEIIIEAAAKTAIMVAPLVGAWIEIILNSSFSTASKRRSSRGSVD